VDNEALRARLKEEWSGLQFKDLTDDAGKDARRAELLARYKNQKLTHREIASSIGQNHSYVTQLLLYQDFLVATATKIPERRFREYWKQCSDPQVTKGRHKDGALDQYKQAVFQIIQRFVEEGKAPIKIKKLRQPKTATQLASAANVLRALRKEYGEIYSPRIQKIIKEFKALLHDDPARYRPAHLADYADDFEKLMRQLDALFTKLGTQGTRRPAPRSVPPQTSITLTLEEHTHG
jgi:hypothetical protein